ncbi:MAG: L-aspartate oxidase, partial [Myxococcales bacterium]
GAEVANMEFYQFHPTVLYEPRAKSFLISEALRGEGAVLRTLDGEAFMPRHHALADLAPRDVVARAIDFEMKRSGSEHVLLDISGRPADFVRSRFPNIHAECLRFGIDMTKEPIPVVPAAHYVCGGVCTELHGRTSLTGLLAIGEVACTGLHGANRLASNSLLEGLVFGHRAAETARAIAADAPRALQVPDWDPGKAVPPDEGVIVKQNWDEIRQLMWNYVGIVRTDKRLARAERRLDNLVGEIQEYYWGYLVTRDVIELRNLADVARLIVSCAKERKESRGLHYTLSWPGIDPAQVQDTVLVRGKPAPQAWPRR